MIKGNNEPYIFKMTELTYHVGWQLLRSVMTVTKITFFCKPCHFRTHKGICCIMGWTLIIISGLYSIRPASTSLQSHTQQKKIKKVPLNLLTQTLDSLSFRHPITFPAQETNDFSFNSNQHCVLISGVGKNHFQEEPTNA